MTGAVGAEPGPPPRTLARWGGGHGWDCPAQDLLTAGASSTQVSFGIKHRGVTPAAIDTGPSNPTARRRLRSPPARSIELGGGPCRH